MRSITELMSLKDRVAVVTGGAGKIGEAYCEALAELGATVCVLDIDGPAAEVRSRELRENFKVESSAVPVDIAVEDEVASAIDSVVKRHGKIDILIGNAAYPPREFPAEGLHTEQQNLDQWRANLEVILNGSFLVVRACAPWLKKSGKGVIVTTGSIYGLVGPDFRLYEGTDMLNPAYYAAAKGGLIQLTRYWATTMAPDVRVNCIVPGGVARSQPETFVSRYEYRTPLGRMATEEDLKGALVFLVSDLSAYVTGQVLAVDGGWTAW